MNGKKINIYVLKARTFLFIVFLIALMCFLNVLVRDPLVYVYNSLEKTTLIKIIFTIIGMILSMKMYFGIIILLSVFVIKKRMINLLIDPNNASFYERNSIIDNEYKLVDYHFFSYKMGSIVRLNKRIYLVTSKNPLKADEFFKTNLEKFRTCLKNNFVETNTVLDERVKFTMRLLFICFLLIIISSIIVVIYFSNH